MSMNLTPEKFSCEPEYLLAGTDICVTTAVKKAASALKAGAPVKGGWHDRPVRHHHRGFQIR